MKQINFDDPKYHTVSGNLLERKYSCPICNGELIARYKLLKRNINVFEEIIFLKCDRCKTKYFDKSNTSVFGLETHGTYSSEDFLFNQKYASSIKEFIKIAENSNINREHLNSIDELLEYAQSKNRYIFSAKIEKDYHTSLYLNIRCFTYEANVYEGWFEKSYNIPFTLKYENNNSRYQTRKEDVDKAIEQFKKDLSRHESTNNTLKNRIKNDCRIQIWLTIVALSIILVLIYPFYELPLEEKFYTFISWLFLYSLISLTIAFINNRGCKRQCECFPISFFIIHTIAAIPYILLILYNTYF